MYILYFEQAIYKLVHGMVIKTYTDPPLLYSEGIGGGGGGEVGILGMRLRHISMLITVSMFQESPANYIITFIFNSLLPHSHLS